MKESMTGYPPQLIDDEEKLWLASSPDGTGSLFGVIEASLSDSSDGTGSVLVDVAEQAPAGYSDPESMDVLQRQYLSRGIARVAVTSTVEVTATVSDRDVDDQRDTPYSELGGGLGRDVVYHRHAVEVARKRSLDENMNIILHDYQPWMRDIAIGVERYDLLNLTIADVKMMTKPDRRKAALYIDGFMEGLKTIRRLVMYTHEGVAEYHPFFDKYSLPGRGAPSPEELKAYMVTLDAFEAILIERGAAQYFVDYAYDEINRSASARAKSRKMNKDCKGDTPRIRHDSKLQRPVVELIPRGSGIVPDLY